MTARQPLTRRRFIAAAITLTGAGGIAAITAGLRGFGTPPTYQQVPVVDKPFTAEDPDTYTGQDTPPDMGPMELAIPSLSIHASLVDGGLEPGTNKIVIPSAELVGHYTLAAPIGSDKGSTLLAGHVNHADWSPGALWDLSNAQSGAHIYVTDTTGKQFRYKITAARTITRQPLPEDTYRTDGDPQLVVVTCAGTPGPDGQIMNYDQNTIITASKEGRPS